MYPPGTTLLLLLTGIFLILVGWKKIGVFLVVAGGVVLFVFSLNWTGLTLLHSPWNVICGSYQSEWLTPNDWFDQLRFASSV